MFNYLMLNERNGMTKIGYSKDPKFREATLQSQEPEVKMIFKYKGTRATERAVQNEFATSRVRGEWFNLSDDQMESSKAHVIMLNWLETAYWDEAQGEYVTD